MRGRGEKMLDEIAFLFLCGAFARLHSDHTLAAAPLRTKRAHSRAFDKTAMGDANDAALIGDEVFHVNLGLGGRNLRQARRSVFVANFAELFFDYREDALLLCQNIAKIFDRLEQVLVFLVDLFAFEPGELIQTKIKDLISLLFAESVTSIR